MNKIGNKYHRKIFPHSEGEAIVVDVYNVLDAFNATCPATAHAIKKLLCAGLRGKGSTVQDLEEALECCERAVTLAKVRENQRPKPKQETTINLESFMKP